MKKIILFIAALIMITATSFANSNKPLNDPEPVGAEGACVVRDMYTSAPDYNAPDFLPGYGKKNLPPSKFKDGKATVTQVRVLCTQADYEQLQRKYCEMNTSGGPTQWEAQINHADGSIYAAGCASSGCDYHSCPAA